MVEQSRRQYTLDDYFSLQRGIELKLEYFNGEIYAMAGGSANHNRISLNILRVFAAALAGSSCEAFGSDMRVSTPAGLYTYPDASIICGPRVSGTAETISNTIVIVEVLSDSTRNYDRGEKFALYRSIPALRHYLLIEQSFSHVEHRRFETDGSWSHEIKESPDQIVQLSEAGIDLPVARIYEGVEIVTTTRSH
ncbi:MAG TPA: Uma2 family endonuclease [Thermoanaerobaculia bacterium]|nr:Uma2 family endonuclease [Thermoanaerobaculia bacterium]